MSKQKEHLDRLSTKKKTETKIKYDVIVSNSKELLKNKPYLSVQNIADILCLSYYTVYTALKTSSDIFISTKNNGKRSFGSNNRGHDKRQSIQDAEYTNIIRLYEEELLTMKQIGYQYNCTAGAVLNFFKKHKINRRSISDANKLIWTDEKRAQARETGINNYLNSRKKDTLPERKFYEWALLNKHNIIKQYKIIGSHHPYDFFLPDKNLLVEIDGTFWHSLPKQKIRDTAQVEYAVNSGYNIIRIDATQASKCNYDFNSWINVGDIYV